MLSNLSRPNYEMKIVERDILVSYDVSSPFTNVPVDETIEILAEKSFKDDWFNKQYEYRLLQKTSFSNSKEICASKQTELPWAFR